jgi:predicted nucleic acid-binding protein
MTAPAIMLDTNVLSELMRAAANPNVARFVATLATPLVSVAVFHELGYGVDLLPEGARKTRMQARIGGLKVHFEDCTVPIDSEIARLSGTLRATAELRGGELAPMDSLIAACAMSRSARLATRNTRHFKNLGLDLVNPWD